MELGERIAVLREERALRQAELAERAKISASTLSQIESGRVPRPHVGTVRKIARALGVEPMTLRRTEEPALSGKGAAPDPGPPDPEGSARDIARDAALRAAEQTRKTVNRDIASEGIPQPSYFVHDFNEALPILSRRYPDELADALLEAERDIVDLKLELDQKGRENAMLRDRLQKREQAHS